MSDEMTPEEKLKKENLDMTYSVLDNSESDFEKKIVYISAGALALSLSFNELLMGEVQLSAKWVLACSWICLALSLLINLTGHLISIKFQLIQVEEIRSGEDIRVKVIKRNKFIHKLNTFNLCLLWGGVILLIIYAVINLY